MFFLIASLVASSQPSDGKIAKIAVKSIENGAPAESIAGYDENTRLSFLHDYRMNDSTIDDTESRLKGCKPSALSHDEGSSIYSVKWNCPVEALRNTFSTILTVDGGKIVRIDSQDAPLVVAPAR